ncbi:MAG: alpha/beta hydrolase [Verrucomicrobiota bacterium]
MATYEGYTTAEEFHEGYDNFITPQVVAHWEAIFRADSARTLAERPDRRELRYGPGARNAIDFFPAAGVPVAPLLVATHGGLWFLFDKWFMHFLAGAFNRAGVHVACINYGLAPANDLSGIVAECRAAVAHLRSEAPALGIDGKRISVLGHSAAGQLAALVAADQTLKLHAWIGVSGFYDIEPFAQTHFHTFTKFPLEQYAAWNPLRHVSAQTPPALLITGARESSLLQQMTAHEAAALRAHGVPVETICAPGESHFSVLHAIGDATSPLFAAALRRVLG